MASADLDDDKGTTVTYLVWIMAQLHRLDNVDVITVGCLLASFSTQSITNAHQINQKNIPSYVLKDAKN